MLPVEQTVVQNPTTSVDQVNAVKEPKKRKKFIIIGSIFGAGILLALILLLALSSNSNSATNNSTSNNNTGIPVQNNQNTSNDYTDFLPPNACPDSLVQEGDKQYGMLDGKRYAMQIENFQYYDANCKNGGQPSTQAIQYGPNYNLLSECNGTPIFNTLPVELSSLDFIMPLGNIGVPDHTIPTDHVYFILKRTSEGFEGKTIPTNIKSPGALVVTSIVHTSESKNGQVITDDYGLEFAGCKGVFYYFGHIQIINNDKLKFELDSIPDSQCVNSTPADNTEVSTCSKKIDIKLSNGE